MRLANGHWVLIYNDTTNGRNSLAVSLSKDEGKTWPITRHLEKHEKGSYHYPAIIQGADGTIHAVYSYFVDGRQEHEARGLQRGLDRSRRLPSRSLRPRDRVKRPAIALRRWQVNPGDNALHAIHMSFADASLVTGLVSLPRARLAAENRRQALRDHSCRRRRHVALGQHGHDPGHGAGHRLVGQHHGAVPLVQGNRGLRQGASRKGFWHPPDAQLRVEGLSLGTGRPRESVPSLVDAEGYLWGGVPDVVAHAKAAEVETELRAQVKRALEFGVPVSHLDTHMGAVVSRPDLVEVYVKLGVEFNVPVFFLRAARRRASAATNPQIEPAAPECSSCSTSIICPCSTSMTQYYTGESYDTKKKMYLEGDRGHQARRPLPDHPLRLQQRRAAGHHVQLADPRQRPPGVHRSRGDRSREEDRASKSSPGSSCEQMNGECLRQTSAAWRQSVRRPSDRRQLRRTPMLFGAAGKALMSACHSELSSRRGIREQAVAMHEQEDEGAFAVQNR